MIYYLCSDGSMAPRFEFQEQPDNASFIIPDFLARSLLAKNQKIIIRYFNILLYNCPEKFIKVRNCYMVKHNHAIYIRSLLLEKKLINKKWYT